MTHWRIFKEIFWQMFYWRVLRNYNKVILDAPLLFETKILEYFCMPIITVTIGDEKEQIKRLRERNPLSEE